MSEYAKLKKEVKRDGSLIIYLLCISNKMAFTLYVLGKNNLSVTFK